MQPIEIIDVAPPIDLNREEVENLFTMMKHKLMAECLYNGYMLEIIDVAPPIDLNREK